MSQTPHRRIPLPYIADPHELAEYISVASDNYPGRELLLLPLASGTSYAEDDLTPSPRPSTEPDTPLAKAPVSVASAEPDPLEFVASSEPPVVSCSAERPAPATIFSSVGLPNSMKTLGMSAQACTIADRLCQAWIVRHEIHWRPAHCKEGPSLDDWLVSAKSVLREAECIFRDEGEAWPTKQRGRFDAVCGLVHAEDKRWVAPEVLQDRLKRWGWVHASKSYTHRKAIEERGPYFPVNKVCSNCAKGWIKPCAVRCTARSTPARCFACAKQNKRCDLASDEVDVSSPSDADDPGVGDEDSRAESDSAPTPVAGERAASKRKEAPGGDKGDVAKRLRSLSPVPDKRKIMATLEHWEATIEELRDVFDL